MLLEDLKEYFNFNWFVSDDIKEVNSPTEQDVKIGTAKTGLLASEDTNEEQIKSELYKGVLPQDGGQE